jgi:hypothetical protein
MNNNFVSKTNIDASNPVRVIVPSHRYTTTQDVSPNDTFKISLGVDSALRVSYPPARTLNRTASQYGYGFLAKEKQSILAQSQRITVRNSHPTSVSLRVLDHLPVSNDARIKVNVIAPRGLDPTLPSSAPTANTLDEGKGKGKERPWTSLQRGVRARWAPLDVGGEGTVEWSCEIGPSEEVELELAWEVAAQAGLRWDNV